MSTLGFFSAWKKDCQKMSDSEKITLLKTLQADFSEIGNWTTEWFEQNGITCPESSKGACTLQANLEKELADLSCQVECKKQELEALTKRCEEVNSKQQELLKLLADKDNELQEGKKIEESQTVTSILKDTIIEDLKAAFDDKARLIMETLSSKIDQENRELVRTLDKVEDKLMRKEADLQGFQEDSHLKATAPYLRQFIHLGDMIRKVLEDNPSTVEQSASYLQEQFERLVDSIDFILRDFSVETFRHEAGNTTFDPHTQQAFEYPTNDASLDKKVRRTLNPGYVWTLPYIIKAKANGEEHPLKEYRMIFRREQVECFKYIAKESENQ